MKVKILTNSDVSWKGLHYYISLKKKWNLDKYGIPWKRYAGKPSVGAVVKLLGEFNPSSYEDFYAKYLENGSATKDDPSIQPKDRGRTLDELEMIAINWRNTVGDFDTPLSEYFDAIILHIIVETFVGVDFENRAVKELTNNGYGLEKSNDEEDSAMNIDLKVYGKDGKLGFFLQVKPLSFIYSDKKHTIEDRINAFAKHIKGNKTYPGVPYYYLIYDGSTNKWVYNNDAKRCLFKYEELVLHDGTPAKSKYMLKKNEKDCLTREY